MKNGEWTRRLTGEPSLKDLLADSCTHAVMRGDGVDMICLLNTIAAAQTRLRQPSACLAA